MLNGDLLFCQTKSEMLYITSLCSSKKRIGDTVQELVQLGFRNIELTGGTKFYDTFEKDLFDLKKEYQLNFLIHNYFPPQPNDFHLNLASGSPDLKEKTLNIIEKAINLSRKFGNNLYSFHPGLKNDLTLDLKGKFFVKSNEISNKKENIYHLIDIIINKLNTNSFRIALENLYPLILPNLHSFIATQSDIEEFLNYYKDRQNVGFLLDLGHLNVAANYFKFYKKKILNDLFSKYPDKIFEFHISENDGRTDSHKVSLVDSWQIEFLTKNREALKDIPIVFEWHYSANPLAYERFKIIKDKLGY